MDRTRLEPPPRLVVMGRNDSYALGAGWYPVHAGPAGIPCRWMSPRAVIFAPEGPIKRLILTVTPPPAQEAGFGVSLYRDQAFLGHAAVVAPQGEWCIVSIPLDETFREGCRLILASEIHSAIGVKPVSFRPHKALNNGDLRDLGLLVSAIRFAM